MIQFNKFDFIIAFAQVLDLANDSLAAHHQRTAFIVDQLGRRLPLTRLEHHRAVLAASLHDIGLVPLGSRADDLLLEPDMDRHSQAGWKCLETCPPLREEGRLIRFHHHDWADIRKLSEDWQRAGQLANIIHVADYVDMSARTDLGADQLSRELRKKSGSVFAPLVAEAARDFLAQPDILPSLTSMAKGLALDEGADLALTEADLRDCARFFSQMVDSRSPFTATHSAGVAHVGSLLYYLSDGDDDEAESMFLAGLLHDLGQLGVPLSLMEKPGPLADWEMAKVQEHALISYQSLSGLPGFQQVAMWGGLHHERMNGTGYPFGLSGNDIPLETRFIAVADVLTALTEDRPHRRGLNDDEAVKIMSRMAKAGELDGDVVAMVSRRLKNFSSLRRRVQYQEGTFAGNMARQIKLDSRPYPPAVWNAAIRSLDLSYL